MASLVGHTGRDAAAESPSSVDATVARCREGDERAFEALYRRYAGRIYRHLRVLLGPSPEVDDALQKTFMEAFRNIRKFDGRGKFSSWLHGIAVRVALNAIRARRRRVKATKALFDETARGLRRETSTPESIVASRLQLDRLERHLGRVSAEKRLAFLLYYVEQLELGEVAERLGSSPGATWARIKRTRAKILKSMEDSS